MSLPDDILLRALAFVDRRDVAAAASVNQRWNDVVNGEGSAPLWRALAARHYPDLIEAASVPDAILPAGGWREVVLETERLRPLAGDQLRGELDGFVERIRQDGELFGSMAAGRVGHPFPSPSQGTTATATPDARGAYSQPVYYDWGENWDRVKRLVPTAAVQRALRRSVESTSSDGYYFNAWDEGKIWPFLFNAHRRYGNGEQDQLMRMFLPHERVQDMNGRVADWFEVHGEDVLGEYDPESIAEGWVAAAIESGVGIGENPDLVVEETSEITERLYDMIYHETSGIELLREIGDASEAALYHPDGPIRETLLCTTPNSYAFMPLNYVLARMLSPEDAQLTVYASRDYSVVVDETRNVVFDNFWFFAGQSAARTLESSRDRPQLPPNEFDYTLGGLVVE